MMYLLVNCDQSLTLKTTSMVVFTKPGCDGYGNLQYSNVVHFVFIRWANFTPVKILYKAYPIFYNTAKCKKAQQIFFPGSLPPCSFTLSLFFFFFLQQG